MSVSAELQRTILQRIAAFPPLSTLIGSRVYDMVPEGARYPYISFGTHDFVPLDAECIFAGEHTIMLDVWSRAVGRVEAKQIVDQLRRALRGYSTDMAEYGLVDMDVDFADVIQDPDGLTSHGRVQIRALIEEPE